MAGKQDLGRPWVLQSTDQAEPRATTSPEISPAFPDSPLVKWSEEDVERYFAQLIELVLYEGVVQ